MDELSTAGIPRGPAWKREMRSRHPRYVALRDLQDAAESVVASYRRSVEGGTRCVSTHSALDSSLPFESVRIIVGDEVLTLTVDEWNDQLDFAPAYVHSWLSSRVHLEGAKVRRTGRGPDTYWRDAVERANPGRR